MRNAGLDEAQAGIKIPRRNINNLRHVDDNHHYGRKQRATKEPLEESEREKWKSQFKTQHSTNEKSSHLVPLQIDGETMETVTHFTFLESKITADGDCSHEIKNHLFPGIKPMTNLDSILKSRDIPLLTKFHISSVQSLSRVSHCFPIYFPWSDGTRCHDLSFLNVEF